MSSGQEWDKNSASYAEFIKKGDPLRINVLDPVFFDALPHMAGLRVLDAGCGSGYICERLKELIADGEIYAFDCSDVLVEAAKNSIEGVHFSVQDITNTNYPSDYFDVIVAHMVLMDVENLEVALAELSRILKPGGKMVFSIIHPIASSGVLAKTWREKILRKTPFYRLDNYIDHTARPWRIKGTSHSTTVYHRPMSSYINLLVKHGFRIELICEPVLGMNSWRGELSNFHLLITKVPLFLVIRVSK